MREREAKLEAPADFRMPPPETLAELVGGVRTDTIEQAAVYYDTEDLRLIRAGASLRFRSDDGWTVKLPESSTDSTLVRTEHSFAGEPGEVPAAAASLVRVHSRSQPLTEVARIETTRHRYALAGPDGAALAELVDDHVTGTNGDRAVGFREIEVELAPDAPVKFLEAVVDSLCAAGAARTPPRPKVARVLGPRADAEPDFPPRPRLRRGATVAELVRHALTDSVERLVRADVHVRLSEDPEAVHRMRTATRRLRSDLRTFRPLVPRRWAEPLRDELKWLGGRLGRVRDADVLLASLRDDAPRLDPEPRAAARQLLHRLESARARDREVLLETLASRRYGRLLDELVAAARQPRFRRDVAEQPARRFVGELTGRPWRRLRKQVRSLGREPSDAELHEVRKRAKQARYAYEAVTPIAGRGARKVARRLTDIQDELGEHQDAVVATEWLLDAARDADDPDESFAAGALAGLRIPRRHAARRSWRRSWKQAVAARR
jgi:CHAD domain-containing protein